MRNFWLIATLVLLSSCGCRAASSEAAPARVVTGAERMDEYLLLLEGRRVGIVTNQTGIVGAANGLGGAAHLVDTLLARGVRVELVFAPEHGFRGSAAAGAHVDDSRDEATGLEIVSLYGANRKPKAEQIKHLDVVVFDIQDVGCRFYTYLSTLHYVMEACAEGGVPLVVLDRPNPNGSYVAGPVLDVAHHGSFVGMHPIPVVHGMTLGELARMINGEGWLSEARRIAGGNLADGRLAKIATCDLTVVECEGWTRDARYELPVAPSPALPNARAVALYPSLCFFEATAVSVGRGGDAPFQTLVYPDGTTVDLRTGAPNAPSDDEVIARGLDLSYLLEAFNASGKGSGFLSPFFENLIGVSWVREMIEAGASANEDAKALARKIEARWAADVAAFKEQRKPYLIYEDN
ncbi:MAG: DUF1343 domain-containing protein [Alistipes sp.]|jgi:uncharacterized protein YbbC (DUF1343 family)|nr:DUF1343 domain-containing protein [Alistipes sp.]